MGHHGSLCTLMTFPMLIAAWSTLGRIRCDHTKLSTVSVALTARTVVPNPAVSRFGIASGHIVRWHHLLTDIDDRKQLAERLRRSETDLLGSQRMSQTGSWRHNLLVGGSDSRLPRCFESGAPIPEELINA